MPLPLPGENRDDFLDRCISDAEAVADFPDADQRFAVCSSFWDEKADGYKPTGEMAERIGRQEDAKNMGQVEHKAVTFEIKREPDEDGIFEGYASVFGVVDQGLDVVERGAFTKSLGSGRKVKMLWQHDMAQPIGVWDEIREDERGLFVKGRVLKDVQKGAEAIALMRAGALDSMSIGYRTKEAVAEGGGRIRKLTEVDLFEVSLVTFPMLPDAKITAVKSITTIREFERALRDVGFTQNEAKAIAADGFKGLAAHRDDVAEQVDPEALTALQIQLTQLQEMFK